MNRSGFILKTNAQRYALIGASFGLLFPILATIISVLHAGLPFNLASMITVQSSEPLLWIIDTAPLFLGIFAAIAGRRQDQLENSNEMLRAREQELKATQLIMEERVQERTRELTTQNELITERAELLKKVVDTYRSLLSTQELDRLLSLAVRLISQQFNYYHVGIHLLDEQRQHVVLLASNSEGGSKIIQQASHQRIGEHGLIEYVIRSGQARAVSDASNDPIFKPAPELPATRSELVFPLKSGATVIGVLDLHSEVSRIYPDDYVSILGILSDLLAIAIRDSLLLEKTQQTLRKAEANSSDSSAQLWTGWMESVRIKGYRYDGIRTEALKESDTASSSQRKFQNIPIRLRGQTIGNLKIKLSDASQEWTEDDRAIAEATAERAALALEGARLLEDAKRRAAREAFLSDVATKLSTSFRLDSILRDTVEELGQTLHGSTVSFQLIDPSAPPSVQGEHPAPREDAE